MYLFIVICVIILCIFFRTLTRRKSQDITWPYVTPGFLYYFKASLVYLLMKHRKDASSSDYDAGFGKASHSDPAEMEKPQSLSSDIKNIDAVFFSGASENGWGVVLAMGRRPQRVSSVVVYIKVPGLGVLVQPQHPDCMHFREEDDEMMFRAGGLRIGPMHPMKNWLLFFDGKMRKADEPDSSLAEVKLELMWTASSQYFDYNTEIDPWTMSKCFAKETWSTSFFNNLRKHHQSHYEQMGDLQGRITVNDKTTELTMPSFRDHSYGRREWAHMHRYVFHHVFLDDGSKGVIGVVCQPSTCSRLIVGHWWDPSGNGAAVTDTDFELFNHGERFIPPTDYAFTFTAGGKRRAVKVFVKNSHFHYLDWDWEAKLHERFTNYKVDAIKGSGISEWQYRNPTGRPAKCNARDPEWARDIRLQYLLS